MRQAITVEVAQRTDRLLRAFVIPQTLTLYFGIAGDTGRLADARSVAGWILAKRITRITFGDLTTNVRACRGKRRDEVRGMLEPLEMFNWLIPDDSNFPRSWEVNPQVHERFAGRAEQERSRRESIVELIKGASSDA